MDFLKETIPEDGSRAIVWRLLLDIQESYSGYAGLVCPPVMEPIVPIVEEADEIDVDWLCDTHIGVMWPNNCPACHGSRPRNRDMQSHMRRTNKKISANAKALARSESIRNQPRLDVPVIPLISSTPPSSADVPASKKASGQSRYGSRTIVNLLSGGSESSKRKAPSQGGSASKTARSASPAGEEVQEVESGKQLLLFQDPDFFARSPKGFPWRNELAHSIGDVPSIQPFSLQDSDDIVLGHGAGILNRVTFDAPEVPVGRSLTTLRRTMFKMGAIFSVAMSEMEAARQGVTKAVHEGPDAKHLAEAKKAYEEERVAKEELAEQKKKVVEERDQVKTQLATVRGELETANRKVKELERAQREIFKKHADEMAKLKERAEKAEKLAEEQAGLVEATEKKVADVDELVTSQFDAGCSHILRVLQVTAPPEQRLTLEEMVQWRNIFLFDEKLRVLHPEIPYSEEDIRLYHKMQNDNQEELWSPPPLAELLKAADEQTGESPPLEEMNIDGGGANLTMVKQMSCW